jgi:peptide/nickel transport system substrate-binding protein
MSVGEPALRLEDVLVEADGRALLRIDALSVMPGERIALVGANGAGKSTLLRVLTGLVPLERGRVQVLGREIGRVHGPRPMPPIDRAGWRALRAEVGQVMQGLHLVGRLSARENVLIGALARAPGLPAWRSWTRLFPAPLVAEADAALASLGLSGREDTRADRLSGGERQKVVIARLLLQRPRLVLADEPTAALDPAATEVAIAALLRASARAALVSVVHEPALLPRMADRVIGLADGRITFDLPVAGVDDDRLAALYRRPSAGPGQTSLRGDTMSKRALIAACAVCAVALATAAPGPVAAKTLRVSNQGDALSMDPHSLAEAVQLSFTGNIYEPLVTRDKTLRLVPALASAWTLASPTVWRFSLRRGVQFHDGAAFAADDVVFSIRRAMGEGSDMKTQVSSVKEVRRIDDHTVEIETTAPNPILPDLLTTVYMLDRGWAEAQGAERPVDRRRGTENAASFRANGTGPFRLRERQPGVRTVLSRHAGYWGAVEGNVSEVVFRPIANDATRLAALVSGEVDLIDPVPLQDIARLQSNPALRVVQGPESRIIFLGFDQKRDELLYSSVKGRNPFKDRRVRQAVLQAIDTGTIIDRLMRKAARPAGLMVSEGIRGYSQALDTRLPHDPAAARRLLAEAGYPEGFEVTLNCPNDRYVNDAEICQAVASQLARVDIRVRLLAEPKSTYFPKVLKRDTSFYMAGWSPAGYDAHNALFALMATPQGGQGQWNIGAYSHPRIDELTRAIQSETDGARRTAMIHEALALHRDDVGHVPLHQQTLAWAMRTGVEATQRPDNFMFFKWVTVR